ncbi:MAG: D-alanyl-D-alanine carboxypeptidase [Melioribacteraceae bacterium]|nr:D-alanyl-D-alanine carboxypeptidase [Melioribacteraceae bacterium]
MKTTITLLLFSIYLNAQTNITGEIDGILSAELYNKGFSVFIYDPLTEDTLYAKSIFEPLIPASNVKLYTTATAIDLLSPEIDLVTKIFIDDDGDQDSLIAGNIYIKGFGDALLTEADLDSAIQLIKLNGIKRIKGDIVGDESYFDKIYTRDDWIQNERANVTLPLFPD